DCERCVILHEIAHAVHDQLLGPENQVVLAAYQQAMQRKLVDKEAYASTNDHEFFAEMTCAYFDQLDYFPRKRSELLKHDPVTHKLLEETWGKAKPIKIAKAGGPIDAPTLAKLQWGRKVSGTAVTAATAQGHPTLILYWHGKDPGSLVSLTKIGVWESEL